MNQAKSRSTFSRLSRKRLLDLFHFQIRNIWRVDGLYFLGIEKEFGTQAASRIDEECWRTMGTLEARQLKEILHPREWSMPKVIEALELTSWALDQQDKKVQVQKDQAFIRVVTCNTQLTRIRKGLDRIPLQTRKGELSEIIRQRTEPKHRGYV